MPSDKENKINLDDMIDFVDKVNKTVSELKRDLGFGIEVNVKTGRAELVREANEKELLDLIRNEGNRQSWINKESGYPCLLKRNMHFGFWLGYVGVPSTHPYYKKGYDDIGYLDVHGGLTYTGWHPNDETWNQPPDYMSRDESYWWLGFDAGHAWDLSPFDEYGHIDIAMEEYRTKGYVKKEVNALARQLLRRAKESSL
jgi:hypothetical protein